MRPLTKAEEAHLDGLMMAYLGRKSVTSWHSIACHFELHEDDLLDASIQRLTTVGRVRYDERRDGWSTCAPPYQGDSP